MDTGKVVTRMEQIEGIIKLWSPKDKPSRIIVDRSKPDSPFYMLDISKTERELGYVPKYDYMSYLRDMKDEMEHNRFEKLWAKKAIIQKV